jgi:hypothetical protein
MSISCHLISSSVVLPPVRISGLEGRNYCLSIRVSSKRRKQLCLSVGTDIVLGLSIGELEINKEIPVPADKEQYAWQEHERTAKFSSVNPIVDSTFQGPTQSHVWSRRKFQLAGWQLLAPSQVSNSFSRLHTSISFEQSSSTTNSTKS